MTNCSEVALAFHKQAIQPQRNRGKTLYIFSFPVSFAFLKFGARFFVGGDQMCDVSWPAAHLEFTKTHSQKCKACNTVKPEV